jgi:hypothetical protein
MATFTEINDFLENLAEAMLTDTDVFTIALSNTAPASETSNPTADGNGVLANVTQIAYTFCSSRVITTTSSSQTGGTYKLVLQDITLSASGGAVGPFQYVYVYDETPTSPADPLICVYDYGSSITLNDGEDLAIDFDDANGLFQIT